MEINKSFIFKMSRKPCLNYIPEFYFNLGKQERFNEFAIYL
jgi:hypothetical protein